MSIKSTIDFLDNGSLAQIGKIIGERLQEFGETMVEIARDNVPVDTGNLKRSIHFEKTGEQSGKIETRCGYGAYVELGTRKQAAQPFLAPAAQQALDAVRGPFA